MSCVTNWGAKSVSQADAAVLQEAVDREPFQQIDAITSRSQSPTFATKSAHRCIRCAAKSLVAIRCTADKQGQVTLPFSAADD